MDWSAVLVGTLIGAIMSVVTGVATYHITRIRERTDETRRLQRDLFTRLIASRHDLRGEPFSQALNGAAVVFAESPQVQGALRAFHDSVTRGGTSPEIEGDLVTVVRSMIEYLDLDIRDLPDEFILTPFNTRSAFMGGPHDCPNARPINGGAP